MHILSFLPPTEISRRANVERDFFFMKLGTTFTRKQVREQAAVMGIKENTALVWLKRLVDYGDLVHVDGKGNYMIARARCVRKRPPEKCTCCTRNHSSVCCKTLYLVRRKA